MIKRAAKALLPEAAQDWVRQRYHHRPGSRRRRAKLLASPTPASRRFGVERGLPIDRYYIARFVERFGGESAPAGKGIQGRVLEVAEQLYVRGPDAFAARLAGEPLPPVLPRVAQADVVDLSANNPQATIVADLTSEDGVPSEAFDCVICTQTLHFIYDIRAAVRTLHRALKPGGVVLATVPGISPVCPPELAVQEGLSGADFPGGIAEPVDRWRLTPSAARSLFEEAFGESHVTVETYGNALAAVGFIQGLAVRDFQPAELDRHDPDYPVVVGICAVR